MIPFTFLYDEYIDFVGTKKNPFEYIVESEQVESEQVESEQ